MEEIIELELKVKKEEDKATNSLSPIAAHLQTLVNTKVIFIY